MARTLGISILLIVTGLLAGCGRAGDKPKAVSTPPAKVEKSPQEADLVILHLTDQAVERLGITTAPVTRQHIARQRVFGGDVIVPPGQSIIVSAPLTGTLTEPSSGSVPIPGQTVNAGQAVFGLIPILAPERDVPSPAERVQMASAQASLATLRITAEGDAKRGQAEVEGAQIILRRAEQLLRDGVGPARAVDDAKAAVEVAKKTLEAARERKSVLDDLSLDGEPAGDVVKLSVTAPEAGVLRTLNAGRGQMVALGMALFEIAQLETVWIRIPVFVGDIDEIDLTASATVQRFGSHNRSEADAEGQPTQRETWAATPVAAPPTADPLASTADLYFQIDNTTGTFRPGERFEVSVTLHGATDVLTVPAGAILHDIHGGTWVYVSGPDNTFHRRRVSVERFTADVAVLAIGPGDNELVVVDGTAELFGTEFGTGK